jgi:hypothetical protein
MEKVNACLTLLVAGCLLHTKKVAALLRYISIQASGIDSQLKSAATTCPMQDGAGATRGEGQKEKV